MDETAQKKNRWIPQMYLILFYVCVTTWNTLNAPDLVLCCSSARKTLWRDFYILVWVLSVWQLSSCLLLWWTENIDIFILEPTCRKPVGNSTRFSLKIALFELRRENPTNNYYYYCCSGWCHQKKKTLVFLTFFFFLYFFYHFFHARLKWITTCFFFQKENPEVFVS